MPKGFLIFEIEVTDRAAFDRYRAVGGGILAKYGGQAIVNNGRTETLEGNWAPASFFVIEFPSYEQARAFYFSAEYQQALPMRLLASKSKGLLIEGP
jgi:uncharacterized protein (DUF1330 family)